MDTLTIELERLPSCLSKNGRRRSHWRTQRAATEKLKDDATFLVLKAISEAPSPLEEPFGKADIHVHQSWSNTPLDYDGLASAVAPVIDAFTVAGVISDDSPRFINSYTLTANKVPKQSQNLVRVTVRRSELNE
jgi:hypothetical protein